MRQGSIAKAAPYALFLGSGASGLVYQVVWVRQFGNIFGNSVHSAALVSAIWPWAGSSRGTPSRRSSSRP